MKKHTKVLVNENKSQDACYAENMRKVYARLILEQRIWLDEEEKTQSNKRITYN
jgi:hypothetical protein